MIKQMEKLMVKKQLSDIGINIFVLCSSIYLICMLLIISGIMLSILFVCWIYDTVFNMFSINNRTNIKY